jgi:hypothetical protein
MITTTSIPNTKPCNSVFVVEEKEKVKKKKKKVKNILR